MNYFLYIADYHRSNICSGAARAGELLVTADKTEQRSGQTKTITRPATCRQTRPTTGFRSESGLRRLGLARVQPLVPDTAQRLCCGL